MFGNKATPKTQGLQPGPRSKHSIDCLGCTLRFWDVGFIVPGSPPKRHAVRIVAVVVVVVVVVVVHYAIVSIVVPFWGYLIGSLIYNWLNQKRNYNGDYRYTVLDTADTVNLATPQRNLCDLGQHQAQTMQLPSVRQGACMFFGIATFSPSQTAVLWRVLSWTIGTQSKWRKDHPDEHIQYLLHLSHFDILACLGYSG